MWGPLSKTNHQIFCSSTITNSDLPLHISPCALAQFFEPSYKLFLAHNTLTASWAVKKTMKCPMLPKGFPPLNLTAHVEIAFLPLLLCHVFSVLQDYFLSIPAWKKKNIPPLCLAVWVTEKEKSAHHQQEFSPTSGTWTFISEAQHWVTALKQARWIDTKCLVTLGRGASVGSW